MGTVCAISGLFLTLVGTVMAGLALVGDWRDHSGGRPLIPVLGRGWRWFRRHVLRRKPHVHHVVVADSGTLWDVAATGTAVVSPPSNAPFDVQMRFVRERLVELEHRISKEREEVNQKIAQVQTDSQTADGRLQVAVDNLQNEVRELATESVRLELLGLVLVGVGSVISTLPAVVGWK